jgi:hypothetical protein
VAVAAEIEIRDLAVANARLFNPSLGSSSSRRYTRVVRCKTDERVLLELFVGGGLCDCES